MTPTIGKIVLYKLTEVQRETMNNNGGLSCPAVVVRVWSDTCINLRIILDGQETPWITSALLGDGEGQWSWPVITPTQVIPPHFSDPDETHR